MSAQDSISKTAAVLRCLQYVREARETLGDDWYEMERQARVEGVGVGAVLGRLAKVALARGRK